MDRSKAPTPLALQDESGLVRLVFRYRRWVFTPVALLYAACFWNECENEWVIWPAGSVLVSVGVYLRLWSVRHLGKGARTRRIHAGRLSLTGPYRFVRNPIYIANIYATAGYGFFAELVWAVPIVVLYLGWVYDRIAREEEKCLAQTFGARYSEYADRVRRWLPTFGRRSKDDRGPISWSECVTRERDGLAGVAIFTMLLVLKELVLGPYVEG